MKITKLSMLFSVALLVAAASAQAGPRVREVNARERHQQGRIARGIEKGELTREEVNKLQRREAEILFQERKYRLQHGGHLTKAEQARLNRELDLLSRRIYGERHD